MCSYKKWPEVRREALSVHTLQWLFSVCSNPDVEFLCPNCPAQSLDVKAWLEKPVAAVRCGILLPVCRTQFHSRARAVDHLAHRAERCRQAIQEDPDRFPKLEAAVQEKLNQHDQQKRRKESKHGRSWLAAFLPAVRSEPQSVL